MPSATLLLSLLLQAVSPAAETVQQWGQASWQENIRQVRERADSQDTSLLIALQKAAQSTDPALRRLAGWGLSLVGTPPAAETLMAALKDRDPGVRWFAAYSLGRLSAVRAKAALAQLEQSMAEPTWVAAGAAGAIRRFGQAEELVFEWARARTLQTEGLESPAVYQHPPVRRAADAGAACRSDSTGVAEVLVSAGGEAEDVRLAAPLACAADNQAFLDSIKSWRFRPALLGGKPVPVRITQTMPIPAP
jgi:HEAT repeat protein